MSTNNYIAKLKARLDQAIIQRDHWKQVAEKRDYIIVTEVDPDSRSILEHKIDADNVRCMWARLRDYDALQAELSALKAQQVGQEPVSEIRQRALDLYKPPFKFECGYIQDSKHRMVADQHDGPDSLRVRGWGRISYMEDPEKLQDEVGALIAEALTEKWTGTAPQPAPAQDVAGMKAVMTGLIDLAHEYRHTLAQQHFPDNDEGDAFARHRDSQVARIDRILSAAHDKQSGEVKP